MSFRTGLILFVFFAFCSCNKPDPVITITPNKSYVNPGETIDVTITAESDRPISYLWATIEVYCAIGSDIYDSQYLGAGTLLEITDKNKKLEGSFSYTVPLSVNGSEFDFSDFLKIRVFCEQGLKQYQKVVSVSIH